MVFKEKIKAELKAFVRFLGEEGDVPVKQIVHRCGIFNLTYESFEDLVRRVKSTLYSMPRDIIDNTIASMFKRLELITKNRGRRTKY